MLKFTARRIALTVPIMAVVATLTFFLVELVPGDPAAFLLGTSATPAQVSHLDHSLGVDRPVLVQYATWFAHALHGNLGTSIVTDQSVVQSLAQALPVTVSVALLATLFSLVVGVVSSVLAAVRGGVLDAAVQWAGSIAMSIPSFWLAALLVLALAIRLPWFPATGYVSVAASPSLWISHLVLPMIAIGLAGAGPVAFQTRAAVLDQLSREYVRTLVAAGLPTRRILFKHVLRNASGPVVTVVSLGFVFALGGVVIIESIFNLPGMGTLILKSVRGHDLPLVQGSVLFFSLLVVAVNLLSDLAVAALNPRVRMG